MPFGPSYGVLRRLAGWTMAGFFSDVQVFGAEHVPKEGPLIVCCTHWNMIVSYSSSRYCSLLVHQLSIFQVDVGDIHLAQSQRPLRSFPARDTLMLFPSSSEAALVRGSLLTFAFNFVRDR